MALWNWFKGLFSKKEPPPKGILVVIVGHGTIEKGVQDKGAVGAAPLLMTEYVYNQGIAALMAAEAKRLGLSCVVLNKKGSTTSRIGTTANQLAEEFSGKACAIELHFNSYNKVASGTETLYDTREKDNLRFAQLCQAAMVKLFQKNDRGCKDRTKEGRGKSNLESVRFTSCLVEPLFGDNPGDARLLKDKQKEYAAALVGAALEYLK